MPNYRYRFLFTFSLLFFGMSIAFAQPKDNSPFSRIGLGDIVNQQLAASQGFGSLSAAFNDPFNLNLENPASLGYLRNTAFEVGIFAGYGRLESEGNTANAWSGNLNYLALGFPLQNPLNNVMEQRQSPMHWGMAFSLVPYTNVDYDIEISSVTANNDTLLNNFEGTGGTYRLMWGNGIQYKNFALGANIGYMFGNLNTLRGQFFQNIPVAYQNIYEDDISLNGFVWNLGGQYRHNFKKPNEKGEMEPTGKRINLGAFFNGNTPFSTNTSQVYQAINNLYPDSDTVINRRNVIGSGTLPAEFGAGIIYEDYQKLRLGIDYRYRLWDNYENEAKPEVLTNSWRLSVGGEYIPDATSYNNYFRRASYRLGAFYETDPRSFNTDLTKYGLTLGIGWPILLPRQRVSFVHMTLEVGQFGSEDLKETYGKLTLGFTLNDNSWFFKRKFN